jgi:hypothetical protein
MHKFMDQIMVIVSVFLLSRLKTVGSFTSET